MSESAGVVSTSLQTIAVVGLGYVGLPLCRAMHDAGHRVLGFDRDPAKVAQLNQGRCYLHHLGPKFVSAMRATRRFEATAEPRRLAGADAVLICVPTPLGPDNQPDLSYVESTARVVADALHLRKQRQLIVLESTTYPGTTRDLVGPILDSAATVYNLAFSPEREDPGRADVTTREIPKLVGGVDEESTLAAVKLYRTAFETVIPVGSPEIAEAAKLLENIYRAVNIALVNEMKVILEAMDIDVWEVIEAASTKPFGFSAFYPGPGLGGHCIPIDPFYLAWKARQVGAEAKFIELAGQVNQSMPSHVVERSLQAYDGAKRADGDERPGAPRVLILGLAYKPDIDDVRESPSFELIRLFREAGCEVEYSDPHVPSTHVMRRYGDLKMQSVTLTAKSLDEFDVVVVSTAHKGLDWKLIAEHAHLIIDTRNALCDYPDARVVKA